MRDGSRVSGLITHHDFQAHAKIYGKRTRPSEFVNKSAGIQVPSFRGITNEHENITPPSIPSHQRRGTERVSSPLSGEGRGEGVFLGQRRFCGFPYDRLGNRSFLRLRLCHRRPRCAETRQSPDHRKGPLFPPGRLSVRSCIPCSGPASLGCLRRPRGDWKGHIQSVSKGHVEY